MKRMISLVLAGLLATAGLASAAEAQAKQVKLKDDRTLVGEVVEKDGVVTVNTADGALFQFPKDQVDSVTNASPDQLKLTAQGDKKEDAAPSVASDAAKGGGGVNPVVEVKTNLGTLTIELFEDDVPNTVANFVSLVESGFYDGTQFHRIIKGFMAQGGDPNTKDESKRGEWGMGGPGYCFDTEGGPDPKRKNLRGMISMANAGNRGGFDTNGSQFFLLFKDADYLNGKHCVFGKVVGGQDVLDKIEKDAGVEVDGEPPRTKVVIEKATVKKKRDHKYEVQKNGCPNH